MGNEDLGKHFMTIGLLNEAAEAFGRMRHDVTTAKQIIDCGLLVVNVSLQRNDWNLALTNVGKITGFQPSDEDGVNVQPFVKVASGIALLGLGSFNDAAKSFLGANLTSSTTDLRTLVSPHDVAIYGGLLALATMDRSELQKRVLDNSTFKFALEHEPHIRKAISLFVNGRYAACLEILEASRPDYLLDIHLCKHVQTIFTQVRSKCIEHYFTPYSCVTLANLEAAFARPGESLEDELVGMIKAKTLQARIDSKAKLLVAVHTNPRLTMQKTALEVTAMYEREAKERLRRMSLIAAGLEAQGQKQSGNRTATTELDLSEHFTSDEPMTLPTTLMSQN
jgi:COP9 signalosome complex subunit 1